MKHTVSVIIPLYNKENEIARTLNSVLCQTFQDFEIIVVDDDSSDKGPAIVKSFSDPRITLIEQEHRGASYARNNGVNHATGEYIALLDADDEWMPNHLEIINRLFLQFPGAGMYATAYKIQTADGKAQWANYKYIPDSPWEGLIPDYFKSAAFGHLPVNASTCVVPKKIFLEVGGFSENSWWGEDADLFGKIALKYPVAFSWELGAIYHWDAKNRMCDTFNSTTSLHFEDEPFIRTARIALDRDEVPSEFIESLHEYIAKREINWARRYTYTGRYDKAWALLNRCNTKWFTKEKRNVLFYLKYRYPLVLLLMDVRIFLRGLITHLFPSLKIKNGVQSIQLFSPLQRLIPTAKLPKIAVIMVTGNSGNCIKDALASILRLDYPHDLLEVIVIGNASKDHIEQALYPFSQDNTGKTGITFIRDVQNYGFGKAVNLAMQEVTADVQYLLLLKSDCNLYKDTLNNLVSSAFSTFDREFRMWECRQLPYEHPKYYNPVTLETTWSSAACCLIERTAFEKVKGFDENIISSIEDVDFSWRMRMAGYHLMYVPTARVLRNSSIDPARIGVTMDDYPLLYGYYLRYKFGSFRDVVRYTKSFWSLFFVVPENFGSERTILMYQFLKHFILIPYALHFRIKEKETSRSFKPLFLNHDYELHRPGAFVAQSIEESNRNALPKVSIIVRTIGRKGFLHEALTSIRNQTYPNIETIVVEDGMDTMHEMIQSQFKDLEIKYVALGENHGRSYAGNVGIEQSTGNFLRFLDEDDLLFAHSVEIAVRCITKNLEKVKLVYDLAYMVPTKVLSENPFHYHEYGHILMHNEEFNRENLLNHNYIPIQCALFDRHLIEKCGGFDESLEALEDWDMWIRYSMNTDFQKIPIVTSLYRISSDPIAHEKRKKLHDIFRSRVKKKYSSTTSSSSITSRQLKTGLYSL